MLGPTEQDDEPALSGHGDEPSRIDVRCALSAADGPTKIIGALTDPHSIGAYLEGLRTGISIRLCRLGEVLKQKRGTCLVTEFSGKPQLIRITATVGAPGGGEQRRCRVGGSV